MAAERQGDFIVVSTLDRLERGVIPRIPVHVTLSQWFHMPLGEVLSLKQELRGVAGRHETPVIEGLNENSFGSENDVRVREVRTVQGSRLDLIHFDLLRVVAACRGVIRHPEYVGVNYHPHVTFKEGEPWIEEGEKIALEHFELIESIDSPAGKREVLKTYDFTG